MAKTNLETIFDCIEHNLKAMASPAYKAEYIVVRGNDPRNLDPAGNFGQNLQTLYDAKPAMLSISLVDRERNVLKSIGGIFWWKVTYHVVVRRSLTKADDEAKRRLDALAADTQDDLWRVIDADQGLKTAAAALAVTAPHIVDHRVNRFMHGGVEFFPDSRQIAVCTFEYAERR